MTYRPVMMRDARVERDGTVALDGVSFHLDPGEFVVLLGPNGAGKSTLVAAVLGLLPLAAGAVELFGVPLARFRDRKRIGYVPQRHTSTPGVPGTVLEVVLLGRLSRRRLARTWTREDKDAAARALDAVGLTGMERVPVSVLSGGQHQRVLVARALATEPESLLLDEPFSWMDAESEQRVKDALASFRASGGSVLLVAHDLHPIESLVDRIVVLERGRVVADGPPNQTTWSERATHHHA